MESDGNFVELSQGEMELLLVLVAHAYGSSSRYATKADLQRVTESAVSLRKLVERTRAKFLDNGRMQFFIETGFRAYRLTYMPDEITVDAPMFKLPPSHIDPEILRELDEKRNNRKDDEAA